jgi:hypothetical protein
MLQHAQQASDLMFNVDMTSANYPFAHRLNRLNVTDLHEFSQNFPYLC